MARNVKRDGGKAARTFTAYRHSRMNFGPESVLARHLTPEQARYFKRAMASGLDGTTSNALAGLLAHLHHLRDYRPWDAKRFRPYD